LITKASRAPGEGCRAHPFRWVAAALAAACVLAPRPAPAGGTLRWAEDGAPLCTATANQQSPQIVPDGTGGAIVAWQDRRSGSNDDIYAQRVQADGTVAPGWPANGVAVCAAAFNQSIPQLVSDGAGGAIVVWQDGRNINSNIYAQRVLASGTVDPAWPVNGVAVCSGAGGTQGAPQIDTDGAGGAIVTWHDSRSGNSDIYAHHVLAGGTVDPGWPVNGRALCIANRVQAYPQIASDGAGGAFVTWHDSRTVGGSGVDIYDIFAQRVLAGGAIAPGWPANGVALCTAISNQLYPQIVPDGAGGAIVTWYDRRFGQPIDPIFQDIFAQRVSAAGVPLWTPDGVVLCAAVSTQDNPELASDGAGGAIVAWQDHRAGTYDIYAQRVLADSTIAPGWPVNGVVVSVTAGSQENPQIVADGAGGAIVTWQDAPTGTNYFVFAQRVLSNGAIASGWPANGVALCLAPAGQENPQIASDGAGGAIVTWQDTRTGVTNPQNIYAQRISDNPCTAPNAAATSLLGGCGIVDWSNAAGGFFFDPANWNGGSGPVPSGTCPASCLLYDPRFATGGATYGVRFAGSPVSAGVTVAGGDHATFQLAGNTYRMSRLDLGGAGTRLSIAGGTVLVENGVAVAPGATPALEIQSGCALCAASIDAGAAGHVDPQGAAVVVTGGARSRCPILQAGSARLTAAGGVFTDTLSLGPGADADSIVVEPGGVLFSAAPVSFDLANAGTVSPGSGADAVAALAVSADYAQAAGGTLVADLGGGAPGTGYDALRVAGAATLAGRLEWKLVGGYLPAIGTKFEVLVAHPRIGTFDSVREDIDVTYTDTSVVLISTATTPVLASLVSAEAEPGRVTLRWQVSGAEGPVSIRRDRGTGGWETVATRDPDGAGMVRYEDTDVTAGRYGYRLGLSSGGREIAAGEVWVEVPVAGRFGLAGVSPNPARGPLTVSFSLGDAEPAALELFDLAGRRVESRAIESPRPGARVLTLGTGRELPAGVYLLQLSQGARRASSRVAVVR
jgi:hypothetical protein